MTKDWVKGSGGDVLDWQSLEAQELKDTKEDKSKWHRGDGGTRVGETKMDAPSVSEPATELAVETAPSARSYKAEPNWIRPEKDERLESSVSWRGGARFRMGSLLW